MMARSLFPTPRYGKFYMGCLSLGQGIGQRPSHLPQTKFQRVTLVQFIIACVQKERYNSIESTRLIIFTVRRGSVERRGRLSGTIETRPR